MAKEIEKIPFLKIVYFDEESATDLIYMNNKGMVTESTVENEKKDSSAKVEIEGEVNFKTKLMSLLNINVNAEAGISGKNVTERIINQAITNTVLTDYLGLIEEGKTDFIQKFEKAIVYPFHNSLSYFKLITPYLIMTSGEIKSGDIALNIQMIDRALNNGKGYFEMILDNKENKEEKKLVLRFNLKSFKNSYSLSDLVKMELTYHAVYVGKIKLNSLDISKEFNYQNNIEVVDGYSLVDGGNKSLEESMDVEVFDVLLAGVKND